MPLFREAVKEGTFLHHYLQYMSPLETPLSYDFWCGLWLISSAVGRSMVVNRPAAPVYLNIYAVLCADAGTTRKSSAVRRCESIYREAKLYEHGAIITGKTTPEALVDELASRSIDGRGATANILVSELVTFLGREQYAMGMPGLLTDLYDCPSYREGKRVSSGTTAIQDVYINFLAASTPSWLIRAINPDVIEGGFTSRCLFIIEEKRKRLVAWPEEADEAGRRNDCVQSLHRIREQSLRYTDRGINVTEMAKADFVRWYERRDVSATDPFTSSFEAREDHHILRLAALLSANDGSWVIDVFHLRHAIRIITEHKRTAAELFGVTKAGQKLTGGIDKLREAVLEAGELGLTQSQLIFKVRKYLSRTELDYTLQIMHELEMLQRFEITNTGGRPKTIWRGTNRLVNRTVNELLMERVKS